MLKIAIIGGQCAGKTTVANIIRDAVGRSVVIKFAGPIYRTLEALDTHKSRGFMQDFSDVAKKYFGDDIFVRLFEKEVVAHEAAKLVTTIICDDLRHPHELEACKRLGFEIVYVHADAKVRFSRAIKSGLDFIVNHSSENQIEGLRQHADYEVESTDGNKDELEDAVFRIIFKDGVEHVERKAS